MRPGRGLWETQTAGPLTRSCAAIVIVVLLLAWLIDIPW